MSAQSELDDLLRNHATLLRHKNHKVYQLPNGRVFTIASTPSDFRAVQNQLSDLRKLLGIRKSINKNPDRKPKPGAPAKPLPLAIETRPRPNKDPFTGLWFPTKGPLP